MQQVPFKSGNHMRVKAPKTMETPDNDYCDLLDLAGVLPGGKDIDISSFRGGDLYVGGYGSFPEDPPKLATDVEVQPGALEGMKHFCSIALGIPADELEVYDVGRCYRPFVTPDQPIIAKVPLSLMFGEDQQENEAKAEQGEEENTSGGIFLNVGHGSRGILLGTGSGKVMAELILGMEPSADISGLGINPPE
ncbi:hypothetical protein ABW19_dt0208768 [Dactylella cylindrospora]|nr:hypothetical protein ABW19_dt0208768 [Dactylella cylindrospora]